MSSTMNFIMNEANTKGVITFDGEVVAEGTNYSLIEVYRLFSGYAGIPDSINMELLSDKEFDELYGNNDN